MKFGTDIHVPQRTNPNNFDNSLTFHLAFLLVNFSSSSQDAAATSNDHIQPLCYTLSLNADMQICHKV